MQGITIMYIVSYEEWNRHFHISLQHLTANDSPGEPATVILDVAIVAFCVRINPLTWHNGIALRFDVLGCTGKE